MNFYKLIMSPKFMKFVGGDTSTIWMLGKIRNLLLDTFQWDFPFMLFQALLPYHFCIECST